MAKTINKVTLLGRLGKDAVTIAVGGAKKTTFSVATDSGHKDKNSGEWIGKTNWTNVVMWNAEKTAPFLLKGKQVYVEGRLSNDSYEGKDGKVYVTEVVADELVLLADGNAASAAGE